jgi:hypothetical protein
MKQLVGVLKQVGKPTHLFQSPDGTRVLLLPYGGRVLGLYSPQSEENFYWTNTALESVASARAFYAQDQWHNSGGDRTWLAPEVDLFFPKFPSLKVYYQQRSLDPGNYRLLKSGDSFLLTNRFEVTLSRLKQSVSLQITKRFGPAPNPLRYERGLDLRGVQYAGYTQLTSLELLGASRKLKAAVGLWNLVQMPHGGDLLIPTYSRTEPLRVFGSIPDKDLIISDHLIRYRMRQAGEHKISIRAVATCGRAGYLCRNGRHATLIIRNFAVNPSGEYVDAPWKDTAYLGFSTQACNVNSGLGRFSELEYHIPAIGHRTGSVRCDDQAQVWAFRGASSRIRGITRMLLTG